MQYRCSTVVKYGLIKIDEQTLCDGGTEDICEVKLLYDFACDGTFNTFERKTIIDSLEELEQAVEDIKRDSSGILILHIRGIKFMRQQYSYDIYITQMKVFIPIENKYMIPDECLIDEDFCTKSDDEIVDEDALEEIKHIQELKIKKKNEEMEKIKELQKQLEEMNKNLDNLG